MLRMAPAGRQLAERICSTVVPVARASWKRVSPGRMV
jgi:hypothetical protein